MENISRLKFIQFILVKKEKRKIQKTSRFNMKQSLKSQETEKDKELKCNFTINSKSRLSMYFLLFWTQTTRKKHFRNIPGL